MRLLPSAVITALASIFLATPTSGQALPEDSLIVVATADFIGQNTGKGGGLWYVSPDRATYTKITGHTSNLLWSNCVTVDAKTRFVYVGTLSRDPAGAGNIYRLMLSVQNAGKTVTVIKQDLLTKTAPSAGSISGITLREDKVWYVTDSPGRGEIGFVSTVGGQPTRVFQMQTPSVVGLGQSITTNGREIYIGVSVPGNNKTANNLYSLDPDSKPVTLQPVGRYGNTSLGQLTMTAEGNVFASDFAGHGHLVDPVSKFGMVVNTQAAPQNSAHAGVFNPWLNEWTIGPGFSFSASREIHSYDLSANLWTKKPLGTAGVPGFPTGIGSCHEQPFNHFGKGCVGLNKKEPRSGSWSAATIGKMLDLTLWDADGGSPAVALIGVRKQSIDLGSLGAPGCQLLVAPLVQIGVQLCGCGSSSINVRIPKNKSLSGAELQGQWAVVTQANKLGLVSSDGVTIRIR